MVVEPPDVETLAGALDDDVLALRRTLRDLVDQRKQVDVLGIAKRRAIAEFDRHFIPLARVLEATFRVAGETQLADRIRPTVRRLVRNQPGEGASSPGGRIEEPPQS